MIPLFKPYMPDKLPELNDILHSGALSYGKWGHRLEEKLSSFLNANNLLLTGSYASAIQIVLTTLNLQYGDEVIASPMCCLASVMPLLTFGLKVVWADIDPSTGTLSPDSVRDKITTKSKLIVHNHFCGYVGYVDEINTIGRNFDIPIIDDCVEAYGTKYKGNYTGNIGTDISIFSFQTVRLPNTIDGGCIVFKDKGLYEKAILIRDFGIRRYMFRDDIGEISSNCDIYMKGYSGTLNEVNSYIGCCQMKNISKLLSKQRANANCWDDKFSNTEFQIMGRKEIVPNYWVYGILSKNKKKDIETFRNKGFYASSVHLPNSYYSIYGIQRPLYGVEDFYSKFIALPCGWWFDNK
ncbi:MAG: aminotransferase class V-fold PLP-dependent enzyme [Bacteroidales bacterium]|nr:aminotransferase class V-fold PLP-dependent enzyme [Bacteroidales bacterium]